MSTRRPMALVQNCRGPLHVVGHNADMLHPRENALALMAQANVVIIRVPDLKQDAHAISRMEERHAVPWLVVRKLLWRHGNLLQPGCPEMRHVIRNIRGVEADMMQRACSAPLFDKAMCPTGR